MIGAQAEIDRWPHPGAGRARGRRAERTHGSAPRRCASGRVARSPAGVASSYQLREPWPIYLDRRRGRARLGRRRQRVLRLPQRLRLDDAGPRAPGDHRRRSQERAALGTHFAAPTEDGIVVAEELARRFRLPKWRYTNSGSEATMDAIRIARGLTGRETIVKIFGSYHGHHDAVMVSIGVEYDRIGDRDDLASLPYGAGIPQAVVDLTVAVPFNDADAMERRIERLAAEGRLPGLRDHGGGDDEPRGRAPRAGLPRGGPRDHPRARHRADLRRGEDGPDRRRRRRGRALRRRPGHGHPREVARRRAAVGRDRRDRGGDGLRRGRARQPGRHVQRQPADDGGGAGEPASRC